MSSSCETTTVSVRDINFGVTIRCPPQAQHAVLCLPGALGTGPSDFGPWLQHGLTVTTTGDATTETTVSVDNNNTDDHNRLALFALDPRGLGRSTRCSSSGGTVERDFPLDFYRRDAEDAAAVMDALLDRDDYQHFDNYSVFGWSDGANVAVHLAGAVAAPRKLVVWGGNPTVTEHDIQAWEAIRDVSTSWSELARNHKLQCVTNGNLEQLQHLNDKAIDGWIRYWHERNGDVCLQELPRIRCPTLILHGDNDRVCHVSHAETMAQRIPQSQLHIVPGGTHNLHQSRRTAPAFAALVTRFLLNDDHAVDDTPENVGARL